MTRVLICGGRNIGRASIIGTIVSAETKESFYRASAQRGIMTFELNRLHSEYSFTAVICGNGKGAERVGLEWAEARGIQVIEFKPLKNMLWRESTYARNERMLTIGQPDLCVAFGGADATDELIAQVEKRGIKVIRIDIE